MSGPGRGPDAVDLRGVRMGTGCAVHRHRELVPLHRHHVHPLAHGGPDIPANLVTLCANGHYSVHALLDLMLKGDGRVPWMLRRAYGRKVRALAVEGYAAIVAARSQS